MLFCDKKVFKEVFRLLVLLLLLEVVLLLLVVVLHLPLVMLLLLAVVDVVAIGGKLFFLQRSWKKLVVLCFCLDSREA